MTPFRKLAAALLTAVTVGTAEYAGAKPPPGPPWPPAASAPAGNTTGERDPADAPKESWAGARLNGTTGTGRSVKLEAWAAVAKPVVGQEYELDYQFTTHTKKGVDGKLVTRPDDKIWHLKLVKCEHDWIEYYVQFELHRKDLTGLKGMPEPADGRASHEVFLRCEPQLFDLTAKKYLTRPKTDAVIVVATVEKGGKVTELRTLGDWVEATGKTDPDKVIDTLDDRDEYGLEANGVEAAFANLLGDKDVTADAKKTLIRDLPKELVHAKGAVWPRLKELAAGDDADLKVAAKKKLGE